VLGTVYRRADDLPGAHAGGSGGEAGEDSELTTTFERKCEKVAEATGVAVYFPRIPGEKYQAPFEDDGCLHIMHKSERACFGIGQDLSGQEQNERIRAVMTAMGKRITERVLVDEEDDEDEETCEYCGHAL
jgi:hypothetical protein